MRIVYIILLILLAICSAPIVSVWWASSFAQRHGCVLHEGFANPCVVNGVDHGERLYAAGVSGWLMLVTVPVGAVILLVLLILGLRDLLRWRRR